MGLRTLCWGGWQHPEKLIESNRPKMVYVPLKCNNPEPQGQESSICHCMCSSVKNYKEEKITLSGICSTSLTRHLPVTFIPPLF